MGVRWRVACCWLAPRLGRVPNHGDRRAPHIPYHTPHNTQPDLRDGRLLAAARTHRVNVIAKRGRPAIEALVVHAPAIQPSCLRGCHEAPTPADTLLTRQQSTHSDRIGTRGLWPGCCLLLIASTHLAARHERD